MLYTESTGAANVSMVTTSSGKVIAQRGAASIWSPISIQKKLLTLILLETYVISCLWFEEECCAGLPLKASTIVVVWYYQQ